MCKVEMVPHLMHNVHGGEQLQPGYLPCSTHLRCKIFPFPYVSPVQVGAMSHHMGHGQGLAQCLALSPHAR